MIGEKYYKYLPTVRTSVTDPYLPNILILIRTLHFPRGKNFPNFSFLCFSNLIGSAYQYPS